jgi:hypothetical protein
LYCLNAVLIFAFYIFLQLHIAGKGGKPDLVRESQRRRYADVSLVDKVIDLDKQWRDGMVTIEASVSLYCLQGVVVLNPTLTAPTY